MGRKRRVHCLFLIMTYLTSCSNHADIEETDDDFRNIEIILGCLPDDSKAAIPEDCKIHDMNLLIFEDGFLERNIWVQGLSGSAFTHNVKLLKGHRYSFFAAANFRKEINISRWDEISELYYEARDSSGFPQGIPMSSFAEDIKIGESDEIALELIRLTAKISLRMNRGKLSKGVNMEVRQVRIGNYPKYCNITGHNAVANSYDRFESGFVLKEAECTPLNIKGKGGLSDEVSLFILENMQGEFPTGIEEDEEKVFDEEDPMSDKCSYLELELSYTSDDMVSYDSNLIYRLYLGNGLADMDLERNCHYHINITPEDDGLSGGGWRVDKSGIGPAEPVFEILPGDYLEGHVGDTLHIRCEFYPRNAPFEIGYDELLYDKGRGIYDYETDKDGYGLSLFLKSPGSGLFRMSAGDPVNQSSTVIVKVNP